MGPILSNKYYNVLKFFQVSLIGRYILCIKLKVKVLVTQFSNSVTSWTVACQALLSMGFPRQEYWSGFPFPSPGIFLTQGLNPCLLKILHHLSHNWKFYMQCLKLVSGFPGGSVVKNLPANQETWVWSLGWGDPLEKEMATYSSILAWRIPRRGEPGGL